MTGNQKKNTSDNYHLPQSVQGNDPVRITFGLIVLNGKPFIRYNLRTLYPFAHQIIVVEGAASSAKHIATADGHSTDGTLQELRRFQQEEDRENKLLIVTAEDEGHPNGFWSEKDEMSQAYAVHATGNYLWQIDSDEFYLENDMVAVIGMLSGDRSIKTISFPMHTFWGDPGYVVNGYFLDQFIVHRIFAWGKGYRYESHRPVTILDENNNDLRSMKWLSASMMRTRGIYMYHYELLFPKQVIDKCSYYTGAQWTTALQKANEWVNTSYLRLGNPFQVHMMYNYISWLERSTSNHPLQVIEMINAVRQCEFPGIYLRNMEDAGKLLKNPAYRFEVMILKSWIPVSRLVQHSKGWVKTTLPGRMLIRIKRKVW